MEKIAIFSDVHGNITALSAVLDDINKRKVDKIMCLGDCVTKCVHSDQVIDKVKEFCDVVIMGNCDYSISRPIAKTRNYWTTKLIGDERAEYLASLPISYDFYLSRSFD